MAGINPRWFKRIMTMVPKRLQKNQREIKRTHEEIKEDYLFAVKKSIVDFVLKEPEIDEDERFLDEDDETPMTIELAGRRSSEITPTPPPHVRISRNLLILFVRCNLSPSSLSVRTSFVDSPYCCLQLHD